MTASTEEGNLNRLRNCLLNLLGQVEQGGEFYGIVPSSPSAQKAIREAKEILSDLDGAK